MERMPRLLVMGLGSKAVGEALLSSLGTGAGRKERPQQVVCYRAGDKTGEMELEKRRRMITFLFFWPAWL